MTGNRLTTPWEGRASAEHLVRTGVKASVSRGVGIDALGAGSHQLRLLYAQTTDRMALQLFVRRPGARQEQLFAPHI